MWKCEIKKKINNILPQRLITGKRFCGLLKPEHILKYCDERKKKLKLP